MEWICKYCKSKFTSRRNLQSHEKICEEKAKLPKDKLGRVITIEQRNSYVKAGRAGEMATKGRKHTKETKEKISKGRIKALNEGRGNHWICPAIKRSYAEQYFFECFNLKTMYGFVKDIV